LSELSKNKSVLFFIAHSVVMFEYILGHFRLTSIELRRFGAFFVFYLGVFNLISVWFLY